MKNILKRHPFYYYNSIESLKCNLEKLKQQQKKGNLHKFKQQNGIWENETKLKKKL